MYRRDTTYFPADEERRIKLIIFDMDGVLFDSEAYHACAEKMMLSRCGIHEELREQAGKSHADIWKPLIERYSYIINAVNKIITVTSEILTNGIRCFEAVLVLLSFW